MVAAVKLANKEPIIDCSTSIYTLFFFEVSFTVMVQSPVPGYQESHNMPFHMTKAAINSINMASSRSFSSGLPFMMKKKKSNFAHELDSFVWFVARHHTSS